MKSKKEIELEQRIANSIRLHEAVDNNDSIELEKILIRGNFDIEFEDKDDLNPAATNKIVFNCQIGKISENDALKMLQLLINHGADVNKIGWGGTSLFVSLFTSDDNGGPKILLFNCLLEAKADVNLIEYKGLATPLHAAKNNINVVEKLLAHGADMHLKNGSKTPLDILKESMQDEHLDPADGYPGFYRLDIVHDLYMKAAFIDSLFYRENRDVVQEKLKIAFLVDNYTDRSTFMLSRFKSLCAIKNSKLADEEPTNFIEYLEQIINYEFLPEKLKTGLQDILKDYQMITDNIEGFALQDAYNIYAEENESRQIKAPISFKQVQDILIDNYLQDIAIFQSILGFCNEHQIYKNHFYLEHESSKDEIIKLMHLHTGCAESVKELYSKYKGVFYSDSIEQAINNCNMQKQLFEPVKEIGVSVEDNHVM